jgi:precorrin-2/cobalt-factor-2 C20-methyltransferase
MLYGIGVGPGDPELLTIKAARVLSRVRTVFAAASTKNDSSLSLSIARPHLGHGTEIQVLGFPMTRDQALLRRAWEDNARMVLAALERGDAAFLTLGDPMLYSTFGYLLRTLRELAPDCRAEVIPGVTSFQAAAARTQTILAESGENLLVLSGVRSRQDLRRHLECADNAAVLKAYRNFREIREELDDLGLSETSTFVSRLGLEGEVIAPSLAEAPSSPNYFSLLLVKRHA